MTRELFEQYEKDEDVEILDVGNPVKFYLVSVGDKRAIEVCSECYGDDSLDMLIISHVDGCSFQTN
jgi:hypothetical protein